MNKSARVAAALHRTRTARALAIRDRLRPLIEVQGEAVPTLPGVRFGTIAGLRVALRASVGELDRHGTPFCIEVWTPGRKVMSLAWATGDAAVELLKFIPGDWEREAYDD